ncbi:MAG: hypothetical protein LBK47_00765 [Prevotellaceae bacterium]|jgi:hypothetical protein|nr:hypothetical protein [Prevotellaceae bacterium]
MRTKIILIVAFLFGSLTGCKVGNVTHTGGMDNQSYLQFIQGGDTKYEQGVEVYVDNNPAFPAKVDKIEKLKVRGNVYVIKEGRHHLKVVSDGNALYEKDIIVGNQETKKITLP